MRLASIIWSVFLLVLSTWPCSDDEHSALPQDTPALSDQHQTHQEAPEADLCSPFCTCHCCHTHSQLRSESFFVVHFYKEIVTNSIFTNHLPEGYIGGILHPPIR